MVAITPYEKTVREGLESVEAKPMLIAGCVRLAHGDKLLGWRAPTGMPGATKGNLAHQGTFVGAAIYKNIRNKIPYRHCADYGFWLSLQRIALFQVKYFDVTVSVFRLGGISSSPANKVARFSSGIHLGVGRLMVVDTK